jgi:hypothetical protein
MAAHTLRLVRGEDGTERVLIDLAEYQALLDAASAAEHGLPDVSIVIRELKAALTTTEASYVDVDELLQQYDALHRAG